jgi:hypothetical protein
MQQLGAGMVSGSVNTNREAVISLLVQGPEERRHEVNAIVDTGRQFGLSICSTTTEGEEGKRRYASKEESTMERQRLDYDKDSREPADYDRQHQVPRRVESRVEEATI